MNLFNAKSDYALFFSREASGANWIFESKLLVLSEIQEFIIGWCLQVMLGVNFLIHHIEVSSSSCQGLSKSCGMLLQVLIEMDL